MNDFALYIHWPFCVSKCPYCDFNSHVRDTIDEARWGAAYIRELNYWAERTAGRRVRSIYFGGGTPSLMLPATVASILAEARRLWAMPDDVEITLESNPSSIENARFVGFKEAGVNRVSIGVQSLRDDVLRFLERPHNAAEARAAIEIAASIFDRYSFDLIYGRPDQSVAEWEAELLEALPLTRGHLSAYQLTIEQGTGFATRAARGDFVMPDEDTQAAFFELTNDLCAGHDLEAYEISNYAAPGQESRHNLNYWRGGDYVGIGPGAHGRVTLDSACHATVAHRAPEAWLEMVESKGAGHHPPVRLTDKERAEEAIMMGLRLSGGVLCPPDLGVKAVAMAEAGYLESADLPDRLRTTARGKLCLNAVTGYLLA